MEISDLKELSYDDLREKYKIFLKQQSLSDNTINTAYSDTFYLWRKSSKDVFWNLVLSNNFETEANNIVYNALSQNSNGNILNLVGGYISHLRRFRIFLNIDNTTNIKPKKSKPAKQVLNIPHPCKEEVEKYLDKWSNLENYHLQEDALNKLFHQLCPNNTDITDILIKASTLNDFYSTNIISIYPVAKHILSLNIDSRLQNGDISLVDEIKRVQMNNKIINNYSFATKYCSHHNSLDYPIYDSYVDEILRYFRNTDNFSKFSNDDLKNYAKFKTILIDFKSFYNLDEYNLKQIDQYLWQLGKEHFNKYKK